MLLNNESNHLICKLITVIIAQLPLDSYDCLTSLMSYLIYPSIGMAISIGTLGDFQFFSPIFLLMKFYVGSQKKKKKKYAKMKKLQCECSNIHSYADNSSRGSLELYSIPQHPLAPSLSHPSLSLTLY